MDQLRHLRDALLESFSAVSLDELMFFALGRNRELYTLADDYRSRVMHVIQAARREGWTNDLVIAASEARPHSRGLRDLVRALGVTAEPSGLEKVIHEQAPFLDIAVWRSRLGELESQTCRIEVNGRTRVMGTGFLVGPDLCVTSQHVVATVLSGAAAPADVTLRFDYKRTPDGIEVFPGIACTLSDDWLVASSPPSALDSSFGRSSPDDRTDRLDFALLKVAESPGNSPIGRATMLAEAPARGWVRRVASTPVGAGEIIFILQHPSSRPQQMTFDTAVGLDESGTRLRYRANTLPGSSGAACFNADLDLVAVHQSADPGSSINPVGDYNQGIWFGAIAEMLRRSGVVIPVAADQSSLTAGGEM
jgi:hypothetical protein